ncbi:MAG: AsmA family protein [Acidobacteria bacterium]|nr:AsmA family protein [Acidobacteriota bacterium]
MPLRRAISRGLIAGAIAAGLVVAAAVALPYLVDVNRYRPLITGKVREATGRTLTLGRVSFALLPSPGLSVGGPIKLSDSAAYPGRSALTAESLRVRLGLLGLLRGRANVTSIRLSRPTLTLIRDSRGRWNFDDLVQRASAASRAAPRAGGAQDSTFRVVVDQARVSGGRILIYDDAVVAGRRSEAVIAPVNATIRGWGGDQPTELGLSLGLGKSTLSARARFGTSAGGPVLTLTTRGKTMQVEDLALLLPWLGVARPAGLVVRGALDLDGSAEVPLERPESLRFKGTLALKGISYRDAGMAMPVKDLSGLLIVDGERAEWRDFSVRVGSSSLRGSLKVENFLKPRIGFALASPRLDLNEIVAILLPAAPAAAPASGSSRPAAPATGLLDQVSGAGRIEVKEVRFQTFDLANVRASLGLARSVFSLQEMSAAFYGGTLAGSASVDLSRAVPGYAASVRLEKVDVDPLLSAYDPGLKELVRGRLRGHLDLSAAGAVMDEILGTARGTGAVEITDGAVTSFSVLKQLAALLEMAGGKGVGRDSTPFESLRATLAVSDRRARTEDLALHSPDLDLEGKGWVGLDATLDLDITARFSEEATGGMVAKNARLGGLTESNRLAVYFSLQGDLAGPRFRINTQAQVRQVRERAKEKLRESLTDRLLKQLGQPDEDETP